MVRHHGAPSAVGRRRPNRQRVPAKETRYERRGEKRAPECQSLFRLCARAIPRALRSQAPSCSRQFFASAALRDGILAPEKRDEASGTAAAITDGASQELTTESKSYVTFLWPSRRGLIDRAFFFG